MPSKAVTRWVLVICLACAGTVALWWRLMEDPDVRLLVPEQQARWIRFARPFELVGKGGVEQFATFRTTIIVPPNPGPAVLTVRAMRVCDFVALDTEVIYQAKHDRERWKQPHYITLTPYLTPGRHELMIQVANGYGPAALLAYCEELGVRTSSDWESRVAALWLPAIDVADTPLPAYSQQFQSPGRALCDCLIWLAPAFLAFWSVLAWAIRRAERASNCGDGFNFPAMVRWLLIAAWFVLAANNYSRLPSGLGYDFDGHRDYIHVVADSGRLPLATEGPQMFQSPLYYLLSAGFYWLLRLVMSEATAWMCLRWIPLACWLGQIEIMYRLGRVVFPRRADLHCGLLLIGAALPMGTCMSQFVGNEPLCGLLTAIVLLMCCRGLIDGHEWQPSRRHWWIGMWLGLAMLTKVSALLLVPVVGAVFLLAVRPIDAWDAGLGLVRSLFAATLVAGWYYLRNWIHFGQPIVGGWDSITGIAWWQDPGYRTPEQMLSFGQALSSPIHAGLHSIWDGFYVTLWLDGNLSGMGTAVSQPPWHYSWMLAAAWPALLLTLAMAGGFVRGVIGSDGTLRNALRLAIGVLLIYIAAFAWMCLRVPVYSQAKASYTLGLASVYALLCVAGLDLLPKHWAVRSSIWAAMLCWTVLVYGAYFVT